MNFWSKDSEELPAVIHYSTKFCGCGVKLGLTVRFSKQVNGKQV